MSDGTQLTAGAVSLLFGLLEQNEPVISAGAARMHQEEVANLEETGLLVPHDHELVVSALDDHDDAPVSVTWSERHHALTYFSPSTGIVVVPPENVQRRRVEIGRVLAAITIDWDVPDGRQPFSLIGDILWEITDVRFGRRARLPIWFARRLWDRDIRRQIIDMAKARPLLTPRVIVTSSRTERINDVEIPGVVIVPIREVLTRPEGLKITGDILDARLRGAPVMAGAGPIALSADGTELSINGGPAILFKPGHQFDAIQLLVTAYRCGERVPVGKLSAHRNLSRLFGAKKWAQLSPYIKSVNGLWGFEP